MRAHMYTHQYVTVYLTFLPQTHIELEAAETAEFEAYLAESLIELGELDDADFEILEGSTDGIYTDEYEYEVRIWLTMRIEGTYDYDPGLYAYPNGDPGYPPSAEWDPTGNYIDDDFDKSKFFDRIKTDWPKIGSRLEIKDCGIFMREPDFDDEIIVDDDNPYYDPDW